MDADFHVISLDKENNLILVKGTINKNSLKKLKKKLKPNVYIVPFNDGTAGGEEERVVQGGGSREEWNSDVGRDYTVYNGGVSAGEIEIVENWFGGDVEDDSNTCSIQ
ncbi:hypothetical protein FRX31_030929 [Thalictrum thalictroides]|uniref:Heavy metal-associated isoprenylated plant protein n=1 Tax=Thalictrum thalictroides TaxID=46969 RepID=A0A7J6V3K3_THATH|nr:hypothetical protein FRX31_030929 [Thalictrum thalictroides]